MARKLKPKVYEDQARPMITAAITTSLPVQIIRGGRCCTVYRDIAPGSKKSSKPMNESSASDIRHFANVYKDEPTAPTQYRCGLGVNEPRTLCHESPPEGTCGRVPLCIHTELLRRRYQRRLLELKGSIKWQGNLDAWRETRA